MKAWSTSAGVLVLIVSLSTSAARADLYAVNRSWSGTGGNASLVGTVDLPQGSYTIVNATPNPFTAVNLTMTVNGTPYALNEASTALITGTAQFFITANATNLTFNLANANGSNPADMVFRDSADHNTRYGIGHDGDPGFQIGITPGLTPDVVAPQSFPTIFGVLVPEPGTLSVLALGGLTLLHRRRP